MCGFNICSVGSTFLHIVLIDIGMRISVLCEKFYVNRFDLIASISVIDSLVCPFPRFKKYLPSLRGFNAHPLGPYTVPYLSILYPSNNSRWSYPASIGMGCLKSICEAPSSVVSNGAALFSFCSPIILFFTFLSWASFRL